VEKADAIKKRSTVSATCKVLQVSITAFPVFHGGEYVPLGFSFGHPGEIINISDVKALWIILWGMVHLGLDEAVEIVKPLILQEWITYMMKPNLGI